MMMQERYDKSRGTMDQWWCDDDTIVDRWTKRELVA